MLLRVLVIAAVSVVTLASLGAATAQKTAEPLPVPREAHVRPLVPEARTQHEIRRRCVGRFSSDGGFVGARLDLRGDGRFDLEQWGCTGSTIYRGSASWEDGQLLLRAETAEVDDEGAPQASAERFGPYQPVCWGNLVYLLDQTELEIFCDKVNRGAEPRYSATGIESVSLVRTGPWQPLEGDPELPAAWREKLLPGPVAGHVTALAADGAATIDLGSADGVRPGMRLALRFHTNSESDVPRGHSVFSYTNVDIAQVEERTCTTTAPQDGEPRPSVGQLVTGRVSTTLPLPTSLWRAAGDSPVVSFEALPPLPGTSQEELDLWTERISSTLSPGLPIEPAPPAAMADAVTPAFFNALRGLNMSRAPDIEKAAAILAVWEGYRSQCLGERRIWVEFDGDSGLYSSRTIEERIWQVETFVLWWREMSADPKRLATFQTGMDRY